MLPFASPQLLSKFTCHFKKGHFERYCISLPNLVFIQILMNNKVIVFVKINLEVINFIDREIDIYIDTDTCIDTYT